MGYFETVGGQETLHNIMESLNKIAENTKPIPPINLVKDENFQIIEKIGVIEKYPNGFQYEVNIISWDNLKPTLDIRLWSKDHKDKCQGVSLSVDGEGKELARMLYKYYASKEKESGR